MNNNQLHNEISVELAIGEVVEERCVFKKKLGKAGHDVLGKIIMELEKEVTNNDYYTLEYWELNAIKSYSYVFQNTGRFASAKIAHNVRILIMSQYRLVMAALTRLNLEYGTKLI